MDEEKESARMAMERKARWKGDGVAPTNAKATDCKPTLTATIITVRRKMVEHHPYKETTARCKGNP